MKGDISNNDTDTLSVWRLKVLEQVVLVTGGTRWDTVVTNKRLGKDEDLTLVRRIGHRLWVTDKRCSKDSLTGHVCVVTKGVTIEDRSVADGESGTVELRGG